MDVSTMIGDVKFNYRVGLIIRRDNQILIECNPDYDYVTIPGGRVKTLESSIVGLKREIQEEMQLDLPEEELIMKGYIENFFELEGKKYHEIYVVYQMNITKEDNRFSDNMKNYDSNKNYYKWVKQNELDKVNLLPVALRKLKNNNQFESFIVDDLQ